MNATDVYVEQVIIGGIVVAIVVTLFTGALPQLEGDWAEIGVFVAIAYLAGLVYDRIGDTLLERIEKRQRLEFAIGERIRNRDIDDPFPEDRYRAFVHSGGEELARQYNYLRTRVRLMRAAASLLPAATVALLVHRNHGTAGWLVTFDVIAAYALVATINTVSSRLPRTDEDDFAVYAANGTRWPAAYAPAIAGLVALVALMLALAADVTSLGIIAAGITATILAGWVWIRITGTFMAFLRDSYERSR